MILMDNWPLIVAALCSVAVLALWVRAFFQQPTEEQLNAVREWLLYAVTEAERDLGGGTGRLKLRRVYDLFIQRFPAIARWISFDTFSGWVDGALAEMKALLSSNMAIREYVAGGVECESE